MKRRFRITFNAPVTLGLVAVCCIATLLGRITNGVTDRALFMTYRSPLTSPLTWVRAFTHIFGHADAEHLVGNMGYLLLLGPMLEEKYSSGTLAAVIAVTAFVTGLVNRILFPGAALCGASGVVFAFILLASVTSFRNGELPFTLILTAVFFLGQQVWQGLTVRDGISNTAHVTGGLTGGVIGYLLNKKSEGVRWRT